MGRFYSMTLRTAGVSVLALMAGAAFAQDAAADEAPGEADIVITANKVAQNVQDVPKSVQVVGSAALQRQNVTNISELTKLVPTVSGVGQSLNMRGVGTGASTVGSQSKVGITLDDVPLPSRSNIANYLIDIERIEVLPGPQGTLAGRNATGGLINMVTRSPSDDDWMGFVNLLATTDGERSASGYVSGPISDKISVSLSQYYRGFQGLYKNVLLDKWASDYVYGTRSKIEFRPTETFTLTGTFFYQRAHRNGVAGGGGQPLGGNPIILAGGDTSVVFGSDIKGRTFAQLQPGVTPGPRNNKYASFLNGTSQSTSVGGVLKAELDLPGDHTLTSITSHLDERSPIHADNLAIALPIADFIVRPEWDGFGNYYNGSRYTTQEIRLNSSAGGRFHYVAGVFYSDLRQRYDYQRFFQPVNWKRTFNTKAISAYAHADFDVTEQLKILGGIRYEHDKIDYNWTFLPILAASKVTSDGIVRNFPTTNTLIVNKGNSSGDFVNFDFGAQYKVTPDVMLYATYAQAKQGPIYDAELNVIAITGRELTPLPMERVRNIEFGIKSQFLDRRVTFNLSAFQGTYDNYQAQTSVPNEDPLQPPTLRVYPVGKVRTRGIEFTLDTHLVETLRTSLNVAYTDAKILSFPNAPCYTGSVAVLAPVGTVPCSIIPATPTSATFNTQGNLAGKSLNNAPKIRASLSVDYSIPVGSDGLEFYIAPLVKYASKYRTDLLRLPTSYLGATTYVDLNVGVRNDAWTAEVFVRIFFKEFEEGYTVSATGFTPNNRILNRVLDRINNRYAGVRLRASF